MDLGAYFEAVDWEQICPSTTSTLRRLGNLIDVNKDKKSFPLLGNYDIAIIGVPEERNAVENAGCAEGIDLIRKKLYQLSAPDTGIRIVDLGNLHPGAEVEDTYFAMEEVLAQLLQQKVVPIILGGSQDLTWGQYRAYHRIGQIINMFTLDARLDIGEREAEPFHSRSYLNRLILSQPNYLFNYTQVGYQSYFADNETVELMDQLYFDLYRLGLLKERLNEVEPLLRNADLVSIDVSSIRQSDAPGQGDPSPHGFAGEDVCLMAQFAGMSDKVSSFGIYEFNPRYDLHQQTAHLIAHALWYFIRGFYSRKQDNPYTEKASYKKYIVPMKSNSMDIVFYKSKKSDRWWMEIPCSDDLKIRYDRHFMVPCTYSDYEMTLEDEIPERFWRFYNKMMSL